MPTQIDYSLGLASEPSYGTPSTPTRFYESEVKLKHTPVKVQGKGSRPQKSVDRLSRNTLARVEASGSMEVEPLTSGFGAILEAVLGTVTTTKIAASSAYQQVHTLTVDDASLKSYTIQGVLPTIGGATFPHTLLGAMAASLELEANEGDILTAKLEWLAKEMSTAVASAAASYPATADLFTFVGGALTASTVDAITAPTTTALATQPASTPLAASVTSFSVKIDNGLDKGGYTLGGAGKRSRKFARGRVGITGKVKAEYTDNRLRDAYLAQTPISLVLTFTSGASIGVDGAAAPIYNTLQVVIPCVLLEGDAPQSNNGSPIEIDASFKVLDGGTFAQPIWIVYRSLDTAP